MGKDLTEGSIIRSIISTSWPMIVAFGLQSAFNIVDAYFVGKISADALAAVSVSFPVVFLIISLGAGIGVGTTSLIARSLGTKDFKKAGEVAEHALLIAIVVSLIFTVIGIAFAGLLFDVMGVSAVVKELAIEYMNIILMGAPIMFTIMVANSVIRGEGEMKVPMYVMGASAILNIILDPVFIFGLGWGVRGAALATVVARTVGLIIIVAYFVSEKTWIKLKFKEFVFNLDYVKGIFRVAIPSSLSNVSMSVGMFLLTVIVAGFGTEALAAYGIGFRLDSLAILPAIGVSVAVVSMVGQNVGAGKYERVKKITNIAGLMTTAMMCTIGLLFFVFPDVIVSVFNDDPLVVSYGVSFLRIIPISYLVVGISMTISGAFLGSGHAIPALTINVLRVIVLSVPLAYFFSQTAGLEGVWWGILISSIIASVVAMLWFKKGTWKRKRH